MPNLFEENEEFANELLIVLNASLSAEALKQSITLENLIKRMRSQGISTANIRTFLLRDLREGGQIFGDFKAKIKSNIKGSIEDVSSHEIRKEFPNAQLWDWLAISDKRLCPDCEERSGMGSQPWDSWVSIGLPRTGMTICQESCRCDMVPSGSIDKSTWVPVIKK